MNSILGAIEQQSRWTIVALGLGTIGLVLGVKRRGGRSTPASEALVARPRGASRGRLRGILRRERGDAGAVEGRDVVMR